jgi:transposase
MAAMTMAVAELPDDVDALKAMIVAMAEQRALLEARTSHLEVVAKTADERIATLTAIVRMLERSRYGIGPGPRRDDKGVTSPATTACASRQTP